MWTLKWCVMKKGIRQVKTLALLAASLLLSLGVFSRYLSVPVTSPAERLQQEIQRYHQIEQSGGWQKISLGKKVYKVGESAAAIVQLKKRLQTTGDYTADDFSPLFTPQLEASVRKVQRQFGFQQNGIVDAALIQALNVPVEKRREQLQVNLQRLQTVAVPASGKRIVVNIPEYKMHVYEGDNHVFEMNVVVGKESSRTETFDDELTHIVFSPYWNVPASIVKNEILPAMKRKRNYLSANGYEITGYEGGLPVIRQKPGRNNSLGQVKFLFPNHHAIYFHDTPAKTLFRNRTRAYSHGCVRLEEPAKLAEYLLKDSPEWTPSSISKAMNSEREQWVKLSSPVAVQMTYFTAWIDWQGELNFRDDVYNLDTSLPASAKSGISEASLVRK